ncbi:ABC transporter permease [Alteromonas ponticola]|uniref:ABC transporter permease n=1 Tax=Alteromonas ponticola TaxID=2720613 RepID=A0ABX1R3A7_9ALTE|nr:ABC transporter permease [Alteromonas ponticola]NMH60136.1 ABC transporter permease [Alteromonas ponticola]
MNYFDLFINETKVHFFEMRQYWFETVTALLMIVGIFVGLFFGVKSLMPGMSEGDSLDGLVFGFLLWSFASSAYNAVAKSIIEDTQKGYIEHLFMCPAGFSKLMLTRTLAELIIGYGYLILIAFVAMWATDNWIDINFFWLFCLLMLAAPSLVGLGFLISGLALLFKKVETVGMMLSLAFMGLVALDGLPFNIFTLLPFVPGASLARDVIVAQQPVNLVHVGIVALNSLVYCLVGLMVFRRMEKLAKQRNLIGKY